MGAKPTRVILGLAGLHHVRRGRARVDLISAAVAAGIDTFDVAPAYGNGLAERELGRAIREVGMRDLAIHTKAGLPAHIYPDLLAAHAFPLIRGLDMLVGGHAASYRRRQFEPSALRASVHDSLCRLRVDAIQCLYLHEPLRPFEARELGAIAQAMEGLIREGKIRGWGIAGPVSKYTPFRPPCRVAVQQPIEEWLGLDPSQRHESPTLYGANRLWRAAGQGEPFPAYLGSLLRANPGARLVVSTSRMDRIDALAGVGAP